MNTANKVLKTRYVLSEILDDVDFDTSSISNISEKEIKVMISKTSNIDEIKSLGKGSGSCNFILQHKFIPSLKLNVIYININDTQGSKITKSLKDKVVNLYDSGILDEYSSSILIINEEISDTLYKTLDSINVILSEKQLDYEKINNEMKDKSYYLSKANFRRCWLFDINSLTVNLKKHILVPEHKPIKDENKIQEILTKCNCKKFQLPIISKNDMMSKYTLCVPGDVVEIIRRSKTSGNYPFYRLVK